MKTIKFIAILMMIACNFANGQSVTINGTTINYNPGGVDTISTCPDYTLNFTFTGADSIGILGGIDCDTITGIPISIPVDTFAQSYNNHPVFYYFSFFFITNGVEKSGQNIFVIIKHAGLSISSTTPYVFCGQHPNVILTPVDDTISYISWNYGRGNDTNTAIFSGSQQKYVATVTLTNGCIVSDSTTIYKKLPNGKICWTSVDSSSSSNLIVWDTSGISNQGIDSLKLYFYNASNEWELLGEESITDTNRFFEDTLNNPNINTVRYMLLSHDACNDIEDTINSPWQNTMFISNNSGTFSWAGTGYLTDGMNQPVTTYYLYRNDTIIDSISGSQNKMTDINYNLNATYWIGAKLNIDVCPLSPIAFAHKPTSNNGITLSHSNIINKKTLGIFVITGKGKTNLYPNPSNGSFIINSGINKSYLEIYNSLGQMVYSSVISQSSGISLNQPDGIYFYRLFNTTGNLIGESNFVIQR